MRREAQQRQEICRYPKHPPCRCQRRHLWAAPTLRRCRGSGRPPRSQSHVAAYGAESGGARKSAQTRKARSLSERFPNDWICRANLNRQSDQVTSSAKRLISAIGAGIPRHLCARQVARFTWLCGNDNHSSSTNVAALRPARLAISFRWLRQRRDPGLFCFPELGIPHTFERPL